MYKEFNFRCLFSNCYVNRIPKKSTHEEYFRGHAVKKSTDKVINVLKKVGINLPFEKLGRYTILNIFVDLCKEPHATELLDGVNHE